MGFYRTGYGDKYKALNYSEYICDTESDVKNLPTNTKEGISNGCLFPKCSAGSIAEVISTKKVYMLNTKGVWCEMAIKSSGGGSGGGGSVPGGGSVDLNNVSVYIADYMTEPPEIIIGELNAQYGIINGR